MNNIDEVKQLQHETVLFSRLGNSILTSRDHRHRIWVNQMPTSMPVGTNFQEVGFLFCSRHDAISMLIFQSETSALNRRSFKEDAMPILLWLLGVPISIIIVLMLFGVLSF